MKRAFDILLTLVGLPIALVFMGVIAVLIKLSSSGPVFFRQQRVGRSGQIFHLLKFRTMTVMA